MPFCPHYTEEEIYIDEEIQVSFMQRSCCVYVCVFLTLYVLSCQLTSWHFFILVTIFIIIAHILKCLLFQFSSGSQIFKQNNYNIRSMDLLDIPTKDSYILETKCWKSWC